MASSGKPGQHNQHPPRPPTLDAAFYRAVYEHANDGIMLLQDGRFLDCNQRALQLLGRNRNQVIGLSPADISPPVQPDGQPSERKALDYISRGLKGERQIFDWLHTRGDGSLVEIEVSLCKIMHDQRPALLAQLRDITQHRRMERELKQREEQYRRIVEDQQDFIVRWLPDGTLTFVNDSYCRCFGRSRGQLIGQNMFSLIPTEQQQAVRDKIAALTPAQPVARDTHEAIMPNGERRWQEWTDRAFFDAAGRVVALQSVGRDVHDQITAKRTLKLSEEKYAKAFRCSPEAIIITRVSDGLIVEVNPGFEKISGYSAAEATGRTTLELGLWPDAQERQQLVEQITTQGHACDVAIKIRIKSGDIIDCLISAEMLELDGEPCIISVTRDVTERGHD